MAKLILFHSALGLRPAVRDFADRLRAAGHTVITPDLFDGETFDRYADGERKRDALGIPALIQRAQAAVAALSGPLVFGGFSMGTGAAELLAARHPEARGAILMHGGLPLEACGAEAWPRSVPLQLHHAERDPGVDPAALRSLARAAERAGAPAELFVYPGDGHLFADRGLPEYDERNAATMFERVRGFLAGMR